MEEGIEFLQHVEQRDKKTEEKPNWFAQVVPLVDLASSRSDKKDFIMGNIKKVQVAEMVGELE